MCKNFGLIPIKLDFLRIFKVAQKSGQRPFRSTMPWFFQKMASKSPPFFITFSDTY